MQTFHSVGKLSGKNCFPRETDKWKIDAAFPAFELSDGDLFPFQITSAGQDLPKNEKVYFYQ